MLKDVQKSDIKDLSTGIKVINFHATWCGPCKLVKPVLESLSNEFPSVEVFRVDVDIDKDWTREMKVNGTPTTFIFKDGKVAKTIVGYTGIDTFKEVLNSI